MERSRYRRYLVQLVAGLAGLVIFGVVTHKLLVAVWPPHHDETDTGIAVVDFAVAVFAALIGCYLSVRFAQRIQRVVREKPKR